MKVIRSIRLGLGIGASALVAAAIAGPVSAAEWAPSPFEVTYAVKWKGIQAGTTTIALKETGPGRWTYSSSNVARGLVRAAVPGTITQVSEFEIVDGQVRPIRFRGDDGSKSTARDTSLDFDWKTGRVTGMSESVPVDMAIPANLQDVMSVQVAQMMAAATGALPMTFNSIDKGVVKEYVFAKSGETQSITTAIGPHEVVAFTSQRTGSSRLLKLWVSPELSYIPLRAERLRGKDVEFAMDIRSLKRP